MNNQHDWARPLLRCPDCLAELADLEQGLGCLVCQVVYPVRNGVPILLTDQATPLGRQE